MKDQKWKEKSLMIYESCFTLPSLIRPTGTTDPPEYFELNGESELK